MRMMLAPGEVFEHRHSSDSITTLVSGSVDLVVAGTTTALRAGVPTPIAANISHKLVNTGREVAVVECTHRQGEPPTT